MYQKVMLIGNLGGDPEMRYLPNGTAVTNFSVATNFRWNDQQSGEQREETTWFRISVFGRQAETTNQYLRKGRRVLIEGRLRPDATTGGPRLWTGQDGQVRASYEVTASDVRFLGGREEGGPAGDDDFEPRGAEEEDEIPF
ncbi:MAG: single-stranded DNA-binding protein [Candidatus Promineifilaceae bacterium]